jgi:hypothetical protein
MINQGVDSNKNVHPILTDASGRTYVLVDDGNGHTMPAMDANGRPGFIKLTDGTNEAKCARDGGTTAGGANHLVVICLNYVWDAGNSEWKRMTQP